MFYTLLYYNLRLRFFFFLRPKRKAGSMYSCVWSSSIEYGENVNGTECGRINQTAGQFTLIVALIFLLPVFRIFRSFFPFQPGRILLCQRYQPYAVRIRIVEQLVEHIGRKGLPQTRAVEHRSGGMVYEGDTIQTS